MRWKEKNLMWTIQKNWRKSRWNFPRNSKLYFHCCKSGNMAVCVKASDLRPVSVWLDVKTETVPILKPGSHSLVSLQFNKPVLWDPVHPFTILKSHFPFIYPSGWRFNDQGRKSTQSSASLRKSSVHFDTQKKNRSFFSSEHRIISFIWFLLFHDFRVKNSLEILFYYFQIIRNNEALIGTRRTHHKTWKKSSFQTLIRTMNQL